MKNKFTLCLLLLSINTYIAYSQSVSISSNTPLTEENLNNKTINVLLHSVLFANQQVSISNIVLNNSPDGLSVQSFVTQNTTNAILTLTFNNSDFDIDYPNFCITIQGDELSTGVNLTSNSLLISQDSYPPTLKLVRAEDQNENDIFGTGDRIVVQFSEPLHPQSQVGIRNQLLSNPSFGSPVITWLSADKLAITIGNSNPTVTLGVSFPILASLVYDNDNNSPLNNLIVNIPATLSDLLPPTLLNNAIYLFFRDSNPEQIIFQLNEEISLSENSVLTGFSTNIGAIATATYSGKGGTNTITLTNYSNNQWNNATIVVSYQNGNIEDLSGNIMQSFINHEVIPEQLPPVATNLSIAGNFSNGETLTAAYNYFDVNNDAESNSFFLWFRSDNISGLNKTVIQNARNQTYTLTQQDIGKYISFEVTPCAATGSRFGASIESAIFGSVQNSAPRAVNMSLSGQFFCGKEVTANYQYTDLENDTENNSLYYWLIADNASGFNSTIFVNENTTSFQIPISLIGKYLAFRCLPRASSGTIEGNASNSTYYGPIINSPPEIINLSLVGSFIAGSTISATYNYFDFENDLESQPEVYWYRCDNWFGIGKQLIFNANELVYTLQIDDIGKYISVEIIPKALTGTILGSLISTTGFSAVQNSPPKIISISVSGNSFTGNTLQGNYQYSDLESDTEGISSFIWYKSDTQNGQNSMPLLNERSSEYTVNVADTNQYFAFEVTPIATTGTLIGTTTRSTYFGPILNSPPKVSDIALHGSFFAGDSISATYIYTDIENNTERGTIFRWFTATDSIGSNETFITSTSTAKYQPTISDIAHYIALEITPVSSSGNLVGQNIKSFFYGPILNTPPKISFAEISGEKKVCKTLSVNFNYLDFENDALDTVAYQWFRSSTPDGFTKTAISNANLENYTLTLADANQFIFCKLTPYSTTGSQTGISYFTLPYGSIVNKLPTAHFERNISICENSSDSLKILLTGTSPWNIQISDTIHSIEFSNIESNIFYFPVTVGGNYQITSISDSSECYGVEKGTATVSILEKPNVNFSVLSYYNIDDYPVVLNGTPSGGFFSGAGIIGYNNTFYPTIAGIGTHSITYTYQNPSTHCSNSIQKNVLVSSSGGLLLGIQPVYCYNSSPSLITGVNSSSVIGVFSISSNKGLTDNQNNTALLNPSQIGVGNFTITYRYFDGIFFEVQQQIAVDSVGVVDFINLSDNYCINDNPATISAINLYPAGGIGYFEGPSGLTTSLNSNYAILNPSLIAPNTDTYSVQYTYTSPLGCPSETISKEFHVGSLPNVSFTILDNYNYNADSVLLEGNPSGGIFTGQGINNHYFSPQMAGIQNNIEIKYTYTDNNTQCTNSLTKYTQVRKSLANFHNLKSVYCYSDSIQNFSAIPENLSVIGWFTSSKGTIYDFQNNTADFNPKLVGSGYDTITYNYYRNSTLYQISQIVFVDSIGNIDISGLSPQYCSNSQSVTINSVVNHSFGFGSFTGPSYGFINFGNSALLNPSLITNCNEYCAITYTYTSFLQNSGCKSSVTKQVKINSLPTLTFTLKYSFNVSEPAYKLTAQPIGGQFSGQGVIDNYFYANLVGIGSGWKLYYTYTDPISGCISEISKTTNVQQANGDIHNLKDSYCYKDTSIVIVGNPDTFNIIGSFTSSKHAITDNHDNTASFHIAVAGSGTDTITYSYTHNSIRSDIVRVVSIDSIGTVDFIGLDSTFCENDLPVTLIALSPQNGIGNFTLIGSNQGFFNGGNTALLAPSEVSYQSSDYQIIYTFQSSTSGCWSSVSKSFKIKSLPEITFSLKNLFSTEEQSIDLQAIPEGGNFTGRGISGNLFFPIIVGAGGPYNITYSYTDNYGCTNSEERFYRIEAPNAKIVGINDFKTYCYSAQCDTFFIENSNGLANGIFEGNGLTQIGSDSVLFNPQLAGSGGHTITYKYYGTDNQTIFNISESLTVDSIGNIDFVGLQNEYCVNSAPVTVNSICPTGGESSFSLNTSTLGFFNGNNSALLTPSQMSASETPYVLTLEYTSSSGACTSQISKSFKINALPITNFRIKSIYNIEETADTLETNHLGGIFTGIGIAGNIFIPSLAGIGGPYYITYYYTDSNSCQNNYTQQTTVQQSQAKIVTSKPNNIYCINSQPDTFSITASNGLPNGIFSGQGITTFGIDRAVFTPSVAGFGSHIIIYQYFGNDSVTLFTSHITLFVDSIGNIEFFGLDSTYCIDAQQIVVRAISPQNGFGNFAIDGISEGFINGGQTAIIYPSIIGSSTEPFYLKYEYTSNLSNCSKTFYQTFYIYNLPEIDFHLQEICNIEDNPIRLYAQPISGIFSGNGVIGEYFYPNVVGTGENYPINYRYTDQNSCTNNSNRQISVQEATAIIAGLAPNQIYCYNDVIDTLTIINSNGLPNGIFYGKGITNIGGDKATFNPKISGAGSHIIRYEYFGNDHYTVFSVESTVLVDSIGEVEIIGFNNSLQYCINADPVQLVGIPDGGVFYGTGIVFDEFNPKYAQLGENYIIYTYTNQSTGCKKSSTKIIVVNKLPQVSFTVPSEFCANSSPVFIVPRPIGGTFLGPNLVNFGDSVQFTPNSSIIGENTISYSYTDLTTGCSNSTQSTVTVFDLPNVSISNHLLSEFCVNNSPVMIYGLVSGISAGRGIFDGTGIFDFGNGTAVFNPQIAGVGGPYIITFTFTDHNFCTQTVSATTIINQLPTVSLTGYSTTELYCQNSNNIVLTGIPSGGTYTISLASGTDLNIIEPALFSGKIPINYSYTDANICTNVTYDTITIHQIAHPHFKIDNPCIEDTIHFFDASYSKAAIKNWFWNFGDFNSTENTSTLQNPAHFYTNSGTKKVHLEVQTIENCLTAIDSFIVFANKPTADFVWSNECFNSSPVQFINESEGVGQLSFIWYFDDHTTSNETNPKHYFNEVQSYDIDLIVQSSFNCIDSISKEISIRPLVDAFPYFENFENGHGGWETEAKTQINSWSFGTPIGEIINYAASGTNTWNTCSYGDYSNNEKSVVISPCFDFSNLNRPMIKIKIWSASEKLSDGAVIQYSTNDELTWHNIGSIYDGINWFNSSAIEGNPGEQQIGQEGWSGINTKWVECRHELNMLAGLTNIRFRIAFGSDGNGTNDGFAFDDIWIGERTRMIVVEHFTNNSDPISAQVNPILNLQLQTDIKDVINIQYHTNFPGSDIFYNQNPSLINVRTLYYGIGNVPFTVVDGNQYNDYTMPLLVNSQVINQRKLIEPNFKILLQQTRTGNRLDISTEIISLDSINNQEITLRTFIIEKYINNYTAPNGDTSFCNVVCAMLPSTSGFTFQQNWLPNESKNFHFNYEIPDRLLNTKLIVICYLQQEKSKEILQAETTDSLSHFTGMNTINEKNPSFFVYPNPTSEKIYITISEDIGKIYTCYISDLVGKVQIEFQFTNIGNPLLFNTNTLPSGLYLIHIYNKENYLGTQKLLIIH